MPTYDDMQMSDRDKVFEARLNVTAVEVLPDMMKDSPVYRHMVSEGFAW